MEDRKVRRKVAKCRKTKTWEREFIQRKSRKRNVEGENKKEGTKFYN